MRVGGDRLKALPSPADDIGEEVELARHAEQNQTNGVAFPTDREDGEDEYGEDDLYGDESGELDPASAAVAYYHRHKKFPQMQRIPVEAEYMSNPSDVIDEEEFEDSETDPSSPPKRHRKMD